MSLRGLILSASEPNRSPPATCGRNPIPKVTAERRAERVRLKTSIDSAMMRSVSAAIARLRLANSTR